MPGVIDQRTLEVLDSTDAQCTPLYLARELGSFDTDPCSNPRSHIHARRRYMLERGQDGLALPWIGSVWCNGPYSAPLPWCRRLARHAGPWVSLWRLDPTTTWHRELLDAGATAAPFRERIAFERPSNRGQVATFPCVLIWRDWTPPPAVARRLWI